MFPVVHHSSSNVDYTYHFNMKHFTCIDHFILSDKLFEEAVVLQYALHDVDNTSDHDPVCMLLDLQVARVQTCKRIYRARPSWSKASAEQLAAYQISLRANLLDINLPYDAILCNDLHCCNADHRAAINTFVSCVGNACLQPLKMCLYLDKKVSVEVFLVGRSMLLPFGRNQFSGTRFG